MIETTLAQLTLNITDGKHGDCVNESDSGYYFISCKDITNGNVNYENARQITKKDFLETHKRTMLEPDDILVTNSGTIGRMAFVKDTPLTYRTTFQKSVAIVKPDSNKILPRYLYYLLQYCVEDFVNQSNGAAQKNLLLSTMRAFNLKYHSSKEKQKRISDILSAYDDLIENNQKQINLLEEAAQRLYKEWFVDLRFPGYENTPIIDGVPRGWRNGTLGEIAFLKRGKTITKDQTCEGVVPVVAGGLEPAYYHNQSNTTSPVITVSGSGANAGFTRMYHTPIWASDCSFVDSQSTGNIYFAYCVLKSKKEDIDALQKGAAQPHVYAKDINALEILVPESNCLAEFERVVAPFFENIKVLYKQIKLSKESRDRLLPKLMSGELEV